MNSSAWVTFFLFLFASSKCWSGQAAVLNCSEYLSRLGPKTIYQIGLLVETSNEKTVLGFNSYLGSGHRGISELIERDVGPVKKFLWGGEIEFSIDPISGETQLTRINETSGYLEGKKTDGISGNGIQSVKVFIQKHMADIMSPGIEFETFSSDHPHLAPSIENLSRTVNLRHDLLGSFLWIPFFLQGLESGLKQPSAELITMLNNQVSAIYDLVGSKRFQTFRLEAFRDSIIAFTTWSPSREEALKRLTLLYNRFYRDLEQIFDSRSPEGGAFAPVIYPLYDPNLSQLKKIH